MENNEPAFTLRDGALKARGWRNERKDGKGQFTTIEISKSYRDENGDFHESHSFKPDEILRVSELSRRAYNKDRELHRENAPAKSRQIELERR